MYCNHIGMSSFKICESTREKVIKLSEVISNFLDEDVEVIYEAYFTVTWGIIKLRDYPIIVQCDGSIYTIHDEGKTQGMYCPNELEKVLRRVMFLIHKYDKRTIASALSNQKKINELLYLPDNGVGYESRNSKSKALLKNQEKCISTLEIDGQSDDEVNSLYQKFYDMEIASID